MNEQRPRLHLIRHGETEWTVSGQLTGRTEISLTARGEAEVLELGQHLRGIQFSHVLSSPRARAQQTCELVALNVGAQIEPDMAEWDHGQYEGRRTLDIQLTRPGWNIFRDGCPGGESPAQVAERVDRLLARLCMLTGNVALFSHGHFGRVLVARWLGLPAEHGQHFLLSTASLSILGFESRNPDMPIVELWNAAPQPKPQTEVSHPRATGTLTMAERAIQRWENEGWHQTLRIRAPHEFHSAAPPARFQQQRVPA